MAGEETRIFREATAQRYGDWVRERMVFKGWRQAEVARYANLKDSTVSDIVNGKMTQPTANQIAGLAIAFGAEPNDIFADIGLWDGPKAPDVPGDIRHSYSGLSKPGQRAFGRIARALWALEDESKAEEEDADDDGRIIRMTRDADAALEDDALKEHIRENLPGADSP